MTLQTCLSALPNITAKVVLINGLLLLAYMSVVFLIAKKRNRLDTVDIAWGLGFIPIALSAALLRPTHRSLLIAGLVTIWGLRLANHIYQRSRVKGEDPRYTEMANKWKGSNRWLRAYFSVFILQGVLILIVGLPIATATGPRLHGWQWLTLAGGLVWLTGFVLEAIADKQLGNYIRLEKRPKVLKTGLWRYSRHPNYFGELTQWWGIGIIALQTSYGWIGLIGPLTLTILIVFVSGLPPIERRRAKDAAYRVYQKQTSALIPLPPKKP